MNLNRMIDHTMLKADATKETIIRYCREAKEHEFASVCVNTCFVPLVADELKGSEVKTCCGWFSVGSHADDSQGF